MTRSLVAFGSLFVVTASAFAQTAKKPTQVTPQVIEAARAELKRIRALKPEQVKPHPTAATFPGAVPAKAKRVTKTVDIIVNTKAEWIRGPYAGSGSNIWHGTGLYAAAGEVITVTLAKPLVKTGLRIRIGCHKDRLWRKKKWSRPPEITDSWPLDAVTMKVASPFGGLIYIETPVRYARERFTVKIAGGVEAPFFDLGKTTLADWKSTIRHRPAPWAELQGKKFTLTVPSRVVRKLDDPATLMQLWDRILDADADLAAWSRNRYRRERFVADVQISAGYMHSGYPLMAHLDIVETIVNVDRLKANKHGGIWGFYHELGHNHQSRQWTFRGTTEVTVNLFTLYVYHTVFELKQPRNGLYGAARKRKIERYLKNGAKFSDWQRDPFLALLMYMQLQEEFGWKPFQKVFAEYRKNPPRRRWSEEKKRDEWMTRMSNAVGKNLGPFFQAWGVPTSANARKSIAKLPKWMPKDWPK